MILIDDILGGNFYVEYHNNEDNDDRDGYDDAGYGDVCDYDFSGDDDHDHEDCEDNHAQMVWPRGCIVALAAFVRLFSAIYLS